MPVRTRACSACRKKRIRCDSTLPQCLMCTRVGKRCPGPLQGPLIVDMTATAKHGMKRQSTRKKVECSMPPNSQMGRVGQSIVIEAFFANFLTHFTIGGEGKDIQNQLTWLHHLPILATDSTNSALILALKATAIAYGAIMTSQATLDKHARELYGTALRAHHALLQSSGSKNDIKIHAVSTSVLLSFFEAMQATTADAYRAHIYGAARLLEVTGPGECAQGVLCQLFYHVRTQMLFVQLATDDGAVPVSAQRILKDTLLYQHPPLIQRLMCCIADLLNPHGAVGGMERREGIRRQVDHLWAEYDLQLGITCSQDDTKMNGKIFGNAFMALTVAYFSSASIIFAGRFPGQVDLKLLDHHSQLILDAAMILDTDHNPIAFMRMATPLLLVALHAHNHSSRKAAVDKFKVWSGKSMNGICVLALDALHRQERKLRLREGLQQAFILSAHGAK